MTKDKVTIHDPTPVLDCSDVHRLATFYRELLAWEPDVTNPMWVRIQSPDGQRKMAFQQEDRYQRPIWPTHPDRQQMMVHFDIACTDLDAGLARVIELGGAPAPWHPNDGIYVCMDPDGHVFCLCGPSPHEDQ